MRIIPLILSLYLIIYWGQAFYMVKMNGGILSQTGGYSVTIHLGYPFQPFQVQIDTGSLHLAIRCGSCINCTSHKNKNYDASKSASSMQMTCVINKIYKQNGGSICSNCLTKNNENQTCLLNSTYQDGGFLRGKVYRDILSFTGVNHYLKHSFGCFDQQSHDFQKDKTIDGIWGVGKGFQKQKIGDKEQIYSMRRTDKYFVDLSRIFNSQRSIGLCLAINGGLFTIGGINKTLITKEGIIIPHDSQQQQIISDSLGRMKIGNKILHENAGSMMPDLIIDSGTTFTNLNHNIHAEIRQYLQGICKQKSDICNLSYQNNRLCLALTKKQDLELFPPIQMNFAGQKIQWKTKYYLLNVTDRLFQYCLMMHGDRDQYTFVLGQDFMLNKYIIFQQHSIIIFPESNCDPNITQSQSDNLSTKSKAYVFIFFIGLILLIGITFWIVTRLNENKIKKKNLQLKQKKKSQLQQVIPRGTDVRMIHDEIQKQ